MPAGGSINGFPRLELFLTLLFRSQDVFTKIKTVLVDEKRHIRFGEWNGNDVSGNCSSLGSLS